MKNLLPRLRNRELALVAVVVVTIVALAWIIAGDLRQSAADARQLYERQSRAVDLIDELNFRTQEVRRILLYALHTSDANLQLDYAEQSRAAERRVHALLDGAARVIDAAQAERHVATVREEWRHYLRVRDDVIGLILEGSLPEAVAIDEKEGSTHFTHVRDAIAALEQGLHSQAALQVKAASERADRATWRLMLLVASALIAAAVAIYLIDRRAALEGLLRIEAHKGSILQAVPDPIISTDASGNIVELNEAAERTFGFTREDALGKRIEDAILAPAGRGALAALRAQSPNQSRRVWPRFESTGSRRDGAQFPIELAVVTHTIGRERISTVHISDLTARRQAEEQLRRAKEAAEAADHAKSDFLATMSHELRTPLVGVIGITDLLQTAPLAAPQRDLVRMLRSSASALHGLVSDILDYSRIEAGLLDLAPACFPVRACLEDALDPVAELAARKQLDIGYVIDRGVPSHVIADRDRVRQVLLNLLSNAVKFTDAGEVGVRVSAGREQHGIVAITIRVRDTGCGIPESLQDRLFQRFSQLSGAGTRRHGGAGLGLAISERLSRLLDGSLTVQSAAGSGSTFSFVFSARVAAEAGGADPLAGSLAHLRVATLLGGGIVAEQVLALLQQWGAAVCDAAPDVGMTRADVLLVDAEASARAGRKPSAETSPQSGRPPLVLVARLHPPREHEGAVGVIAKPVRAAALHEALLRVAAPTAPGAQGRAAPETPAAAAWPLSILLVEDNEANRRVVRLMLAELGLTVDDAPDGLSAVERARERDYDVILMDVQMPGLDGLEATRRIRAQRHGRRPTIIGLTASVMKGDEARCRDAGMDGYLAKPVRLDSLAEILAPVIARTSAGINPA